MRRFIANILMLTMILMGGSGCAKGDDAAEHAFSDELIESENEWQGDPDRPVSDDEQETAEDEENSDPETEKSEQESTDEKEEKPGTGETAENSEQEEPVKESVSEDQTQAEKGESVKEEEKEPSQKEQAEQPSEENVAESSEEEEKEQDTLEEEDASNEGSTDSVQEQIKIASYNIKSLMHGEDTEGIIQELREIDADIVGLQEVDKNTGRSGSNVNQVELLARSLGYPYWSFDKLIDYDGGEYGMAILSRYPIVSSSVVLYQDQEENDSHVRKYGRHVLKVGSKDLAFYNTHLCIRDDKDAVSMLQLREVTKRMQQDVYAVLTGDLNMPAATAAATLASNKTLTLLNDGVGMIGKKDASKYIDNIIVSNMLNYEINDSGMAIEVSETEYSDHNLIYTYVSFK